METKQTKKQIWFFKPGYRDDDIGGSEMGKKPNYYLKRKCSRSKSSCGNFEKSFGNNCCSSN